MLCSIYFTLFVWIFGIAEHFLYGFLVLLRQGLHVVALLGLPQRCRESGFCPRKTGSFQRSSWIHFLVTSGAGVFLVPRLMKFLAGRDLYWQDGEPSGGRSRASEPMSAQESAWPQKESCGHKETCDCSYFIQNTKFPTTPMSCSILEKLWIVRIFINF
jgi:hypothetical protein